jgi:hypothetical protein
MGDAPGPGDLSPDPSQRRTARRHVHRKFQELLHKYKKDVFQMEHHRKDVASITGECMTICEDVLDQKYSYHFHRLPDADRAEIINMINNYTREAILPPVVEKLVEREVLLEKRVEALEGLIADTLEVLSAAPVGTILPND